MHRFLAGNARKWFNLRIPNHALELWVEWKNCFIHAFDQNSIECWDKAISFEHKEGTAVDYFSEKLFLQLADWNLSEPSIVMLIIHGMMKSSQHKVLPRLHATVEQLWHSLRNISTNVLPPFYQTRNTNGRSPAISLMCNQRYCSCNNSCGHTTVQESDLKGNPEQNDWENQGAPFYPAAQKETVHSAKSVEGLLYA